MSLINKKIILGVTGGIAIYRVLDLISHLKKEKAEIKVILTENAMKFITPLTFRSVLGDNQAVLTDKEFFNNSLLHTELASWADIFIVVPASANTISKMAIGVGDNLLLNIYLACKGKVAIVPAMNPTMWKHPAVKFNIYKLKNSGVEVWGPSEGKVLCGDFGFGKMLDAQSIVDYIYKLTFPKPLLGKKVVITAGPTVEEIDDVRFISNYSSGKMGYSLAKVANFLGAQVVLISGPSNLKPLSDYEYIQVKSAEEMQSITYEKAAFSDILIMAAAVADFRTLNKFSGKTPKDKLLEKFQLTQNTDIIAHLTQTLKPKPLCVGFAIEKDNLISKAQNKLLDKNLDVIIANKISEKTGFNSDTNEVFIIFKDNINNAINIPLMNKNKLAIVIWIKLLEYYSKNI